MAKKSSFFIHDIEVRDDTLSYYDFTTFGRFWMLTGNESKRILTKVRRN